MNVCLLFLVTFMAGIRVLAASFNLPSQGESSVADTEVSNNIVLCALDDGVGRKVLDLSLSLLGTPTNCLQVAFGHDANGNGVLD